MFEGAACDHLHLAGTPAVDGTALTELRTLLRTARMSRGEAIGGRPWLQATQRGRFSGNHGRTHEPERL